LAFRLSHNFHGVFIFAGSGGDYDLIEARCNRLALGIHLLPHPFPRRGRRAKSLLIDDVSIEGHYPPAENLDLRSRATAATPFPERNNEFKANILPLPEGGVTRWF